MALQVSSSAFVSLDAGSPPAPVDKTDKPASKDSNSTFPQYPFKDLVSEVCSQEWIFPQAVPISSQDSCVMPQLPQAAFGYWMPIPPPCGPYFWPIMPWIDIQVPQSADGKTSPDSKNADGTTKESRVPVVPIVAPTPTHPRSPVKAELKENRAVSELAAPTAKRLRLESTDQSADPRSVAASTSNSLNSVATSASAPQKPRRRGSNSAKFSHEQVEALQQYFAIDPRPSADVSAMLAEKLDLTIQQVRIWFQNRRSRTQRAKSMDGSAVSPSPR